MTWAQRLKRVFGIEMDTCTRCGRKLTVIASIEARTEERQPPSNRRWVRQTRARISLRCCSAAWA
jgi:hypothetical protein